MKRALVFCNRNLKEMLKSPLSYIFALGFPVLMLILFAVINRFIQDSFAETALNASPDVIESVRATMPTSFEMKNNAPAMAFFGLTFIMLTMTLLVSKDKTSAFLSRLFSSPMTAFDYVAGYMLPGLLLCFAQQLICYGVGDLIGLIEGPNFGGEANTFNFGFALLSLLSQIPSMLFFVALGLLFGTVLNEKSAPPCTSVLINVAGIFGGCYFPLAMLDGLAAACKFLPFYPQVLLSQSIMSGEAPTFEIFGGYLLIVCGYAAAVTVIAVLAFALKMKGDNK